VAHNGPSADWGLVSTGLDHPGWWSRRGSTTRARARRPG